MRIFHDSASDSEFKLKLSSCHKVATSVGFFAFFAPSLSVSFYIMTFNGNVAFHGEYRLAHHYGDTDSELAENVTVSVQLSRVKTTFSEKPWWCPKRKRTLKCGIWQWNSRPLKYKKKKKKNQECHFFLLKLKKICQIAGITLNFWLKAKLRIQVYSFALPDQKTSTKHEILPCRFKNISSNNQKLHRIYSQTGTGSNNSRPYIAALSSGNSWEYKSCFYFSTMILSIVY